MQNDCQASSTILNTIIQNDSEDDVDNNREYNLNFEKKLDGEGQLISVDLQYENSKEWENSIIDEKSIVSESVIENIQSESYLIRSDFVLPNGENRQFEAGISIESEDDITDYRVFDNADHLPNIRLIFCYIYYLFLDCRHFAFSFLEQAKIHDTAHAAAAAR